jgi:hypothetical protein
LRHRKAMYLIHARNLNPMLSRATTVLAGYRALITTCPVTLNTVLISMAITIDRTRYLTRAIAGIAIDLSFVEALTITLAAVWVDYCFLLWDIGVACLLAND